MSKGRLGARRIGHAVAAAVVAFMSVSPNAAGPTQAAHPERTACAGLETCCAPVDAAPPRTWRPAAPAAAAKMPGRDAQGASVAASDRAQWPTASPWRQEREVIDLESRSGFGRHMPFQASSAGNRPVRALGSSLAARGVRAVCQGVRSSNTQEPDAAERLSELPAILELRIAGPGLVFLRSSGSLDRVTTTGALAIDRYFIDAATGTLQLDPRAREAREVTLAAGERAVQQLWQGGHDYELVAIRSDGVVLRHSETFRDGRTATRLVVVQPYSR